MKNNMRNIMSFLIVAAFMASATLSYAAEIKIAYIDLAYLFDNYNKTKDQDKVLEEQTKQKKEERQRLVNQIRQMKDEMDLLSENAKEQKQEQVEAKLRELQEYDQQTRLTIGQKRDDMLKDILKEIDGIVEKYAKDNQYTMIFNNRVLLYGRDQDDITEPILKILNSKYKK